MPMVSCKKFQILTNGIISGDQVAVKRIFSLISRPLKNFEDLYYPSFAEWVSCKVYLLTVPHNHKSMFRYEGHLCVPLFYTMHIQNWVKFVLTSAYFVSCSLDQNKTSNRPCLSQMLYLCFLEETTCWGSRRVSSSITFIFGKFECFREVLDLDFEGLQLCLLQIASQTKCKLNACGTC